MTHVDGLSKKHLKHVFLPVVLSVNAIATKTSSEREGPRERTTAKGRRTDSLKRLTNLLPHRHRHRHRRPPPGPTDLPKKFSRQISGEKNSPPEALSLHGRLAKKGGKLNYALVDNNSIWSSKQTLPKKGYFKAKRVPKIGSSDQTLPDIGSSANFSRNWQFRANFPRN